MESVIRRPRLRRLALGALGFLVGLVTPLALSSWLHTEPAEVRVFLQGRELGVLIVDGDARVLVIQTDDREELIASLGVMARPWEPAPRLLVAPADDGVAVALWEALLRLPVSRVVIAGLPGADPLWSQIETYCRAEGIELRYVAGLLSFQLSRTSISVFGLNAEGAGEQAVVVRSGAVNVLIPFGAAPASIAAQVVIANSAPDHPSAAVVISSKPVEIYPPKEGILVAGRAIIRVRFEGERVRIRGGARLPHLSAEPTVTAEKESCYEWLHDNRSTGPP